MYRSRLSGGLDGDALRYVSSVSGDEEIAHYDILGSKAHVVMLCKCKIITEAEAGRILSALDSVAVSGGAHGTSEDIHEYVEAEVIRIAGMEAGGKMHTARSRNDQVVLDMRMKIRDDINTLCGRIADTASALVSLAERHKRSVMPLYTHLQQAQAGTLSHYLLAQADALLRDAERLDSAYARVNRNPLGAGPVGGTSIAIDRDLTTGLLGFDGMVENSIDATSSRDFAAEYLAALSILMTGLSRMSEDLVVWSTSEFSFIEMDDRFASPSSVMPQKKNPDVLEITRSRASAVMGDLVTVLSTIKGLATGYGRDLQQIKPRVWESTAAAMQAVALVGQVASSMTVNTDAMERAASEGHLIALDIAEKMVMGGVPFRSAHRTAGLLVQKAVESKKEVAGLTGAEVRQAVSGTGADPDEILGMARSATIPASLEGRVSRGSSGFAEQERMILDRRRRAAECREAAGLREARIKAAIGGLESAAAELAGRA